MTGRQFIAFVVVWGLALLAGVPCATATEAKAQDTKTQTAKPADTKAKPAAAKSGAKDDAKPTVKSGDAKPGGDTKTAPAQPAAESKAVPGETNEPAAGDVGDVLPGDTDKDEGSGLPVPRFVSLRTDPVNLRSGPGLRYPVDWVYRRRHLPVEVIAEFDTWRKIRDPDGTEGWVHQSMITGRRTAVVRGTAQALRRNDSDDHASVAMLEAGVVVTVQRCPAGSPSCRVEVNGLQGWIKRDQIWGVYPTETVE